LLLRAHEEDGAAGRDGLDQEVVRALEGADRLLQVDDVDAVAGAEDVALHPRVPALRLVAEVDAGLHHLADGDRLVGGGLEFGVLTFGLLLGLHDFPFALFPPPASSGTVTLGRRWASSSRRRHARSPLRACGV